ncbi:S100A12 [Cervus elaphus hippelaphus]|uniref:S100A12 n=1 Tax=Cervus elaphus hippelaphus TaxID=46360 RepID=A0A212CG07_CEREH|nr:S100A12 [Cervus elaphus hippelaphus]
MTKLEDYLEGIINIFHQYSVRLGDYDTLIKRELKQLITKELPNTLKLDANKDGQVSFEEFIVLVSRVLKTAHEDIHKE